MTILRKILLMLLAIILTTVVAVGIYLSTAYRYSTSELAKTFKQYHNNGDISRAIEQTEPFSILLMGVDTGSNERKEKWVGNSDSMMIVTVNPKTQKTTVTSLERDILVTLSGPEGNAMAGLDAKLNAAYASGGAEMAIMTVEDTMDLKIDNYVMLNMEGLVQLVEAVGGITVTNDFDFPISISEWEPEFQATVEPGTHKINGEQALVYARMRYDDPEGDYGRQKRQREVIQKILTKILALDSISNYQKILKAISNNMQTDIEISNRTIPSLLGYRDALKHVENYQLYGQDATIEGGSYQLVTKEHLLEVQNRLRKDLGRQLVSELTTTAILYETYYGDTGDTEMPVVSDSSGYVADEFASQPVSSDQTSDTQLTDQPVPGVTESATSVVEVPTE